MILSQQKFITVIFAFTWKRRQSSRHAGRDRFEQTKAYQSEERAKSIRNFPKESQRNPIKKTAAVSKDYYSERGKRERKRFFCDQLSIYALQKPMSDQR